MVTKRRYSQRIYRRMSTSSHNVSLPRFHMQRFIAKNSDFYARPLHVFNIVLLTVTSIVSHRMYPFEEINKTTIERWSSLVGVL